MVSPNLALPENTSLLHVAATWATAELMSALIARGADVNKADAEGWRPIHCAVVNEFMLEQEDKEACALMLINSPGCDVKARTKDGRLPLVLACGTGYGRVVGALIGKGADVHARDNRGLPVLHFAALDGREAIALRLLETHGAPLDGPRLPAVGNVLALAAFMGMDRFVRAILERMRDAGMGEAALQAELGEAARNAVQRRDNLKCLLVLEELGWDAKATVAASGRGVLHAACDTANTEVVSHLLDKGCDAMEYDE